MEASATAGRKTSAKNVVGRMADNEENIAGGDTENEFKPTSLMQPSELANVLDISDEVRHHYVQVAAYYIAERRGFHDGAEHQDWVVAEEEIARMISGGNSSS
jgi:hypothetical protein